MSQFKFHTAGSSCFEVGQPRKPYSITSWEGTLQGNGQHWYHESSQAAPSYESTLKRLDILGPSIANSTGRYGTQKTVFVRLTQMDFSKFIINGDNNGLKKYKDDGGDLNVRDVSFIFINLEFLFHSSTTNSHCNSAWQSICD